MSSFFFSGHGAELCNPDGSLKEVTVPRGTTLVTGGVSGCPTYVHDAFMVTHFASAPGYDAFKTNDFEQLRAAAPFFAINPHPGESSYVDMIFQPTLAFVLKGKAFVYLGGLLKQPDAPVEESSLFREMPGGKISKEDFLALYNQHRGMLLFPNYETIEGMTRTIKTSDLTINDINDIGDRLKRPISDLMNNRGTYYFMSCRVNKCSRESTQTRRRKSVSMNPKGVVIPTILRMVQHSQFEEVTQLIKDNPVVIQALLEEASKPQPAIGTGIALRLMLFALKESDPTINDRVQIRYIENDLERLNDYEMKQLRSGIRTTDAAHAALVNKVAESLSTLMRQGGAKTYHPHRARHQTARHDGRRLHKPRRGTARARKPRVTRTRRART